MRKGYEKKNNKKKKYEKKFKNLTFPDVTRRRYGEQLQHGGGVYARDPRFGVSGTNVPGDLRAFVQCFPASSCSVAAAAAVYDDDARPPHAAA